jgi:hypothetical protein
MRPPKLSRTTLQADQVLARTSPGGPVVLLRVSHIETSRWSAGPVLQVLDYDGNRCTVYALRVRASDPDFHDSGFSLVGELSDRPARHQLVGNTTAGRKQIAEILDQYTHGGLARSR